MASPKPPPKAETPLDQDIAAQTWWPSPGTWKIIILFLVTNAGAFFVVYDRMVDTAITSAISEVRDEYEEQKEGIEFVLKSQVELISAESFNASGKLAVITAFIEKAQAKRTAVEVLIADVEREAEAVEVLIADVEREAEKADSLQKKYATKQEKYTVRFDAAIKKAEGRLTIVQDEISQLARRSILPPIGSIIAWHANTLAISHPNDEKKRALSLNLPGDGSWIRCDGQTIALADYPLLFEGYPADVRVLKLPNLNSADDYTGGRFLRGGTTSGHRQDDGTKSHFHGIVDLNRVKNLEGTLTEDDQGNVAYFTHDGEVAPDPRQVGSDSGYATMKVPPPPDKDETRPVNMSVVWIMRVK